MKVKVENNNLVLSQDPAQDVKHALLVRLAKPVDNKKRVLTPQDQNREKLGLDQVEKLIVDIYSDAKKGQTEYPLPEGVSGDDIVSVYLRVI